MTTVRFEVTGSVTVDDQSISLTDANKQQFWIRNGKKGRVENATSGQGALMWRVVGAIGATYEISFTGARTLNGFQTIRGTIPRSTQFADNRAWDINLRRMVID